MHVTKHNVAKEWTRQVSHSIAQHLVAAHQVLGVREEGPAVPVCGVENYGHCYVERSQKVNITDTLQYNRDYLHDAILRTFLCSQIANITAVLEGALCVCLYPRPSSASLEVSEFATMVGIWVKGCVWCESARECMSVYVTMCVYVCTCVFMSVCLSDYVCVCLSNYVCVCHPDADSGACFCVYATPHCRSRSGTQHRGSPPCSCRLHACVLCEWAWCMCVSVNVRVCVLCCVCLMVLPMVRSLVNQHRNSNPNRT